MGRAYQLMCRDCGVSLPVGQVYWKSAENEALDDPTFFGVYFRAGGKVHKRDEVFGRVIEKFLIAHRNHHLVFAAEGLDEMLDRRDRMWVPMRCCRSKLIRCPALRMS